MTMHIYRRLRFCESGVKVLQAAGHSRSSPLIAVKAHPVYTGTAMLSLWVQHRADKGIIGIRDDASASASRQSSEMRSVEIGQGLAELVRYRRPYMIEF